MKSKTWGILCVALAVVLLLALAVPTIVVDPFFHFHGPLDGLSYELHDERYQNDGILRHFEYDAILSGTSMCENFKTSEFDALFGVSSVKVPLSGGSFREVAETLDRALAENDGLRYVVRSLDYDYLTRDAAYYRYEDIPAYLYDDNPWNDVSYIFNFEVLSETLNVLERTGEGVPMTTFDEYASWSVSTGTSPDTYYAQRAGVETKALADCEAMSEERRASVRENVVENVARQAAENPDVQFYLFFPPCSIYFWDREIQNGDGRLTLDAVSLAVEELVRYDNVRLFLFTGREETICDLGDYSELEHYSADTNSRLLEWMYAGENELTEENYREELDGLYNFFDTFDFAGLFAE